jgi:hypothetical protein
MINACKWQTTSPNLVFYPTVEFSIQCKQWLMCPEEGLLKEKGNEDVEEHLED